MHWAQSDDMLTRGSVFISSDLMTNHLFPQLPTWHTALFSDSKEMPDSEEMKMYNIQHNAQMVMMLWCNVGYWLTD